jgi:hypothetical protein
MSGLDTYETMIGAAIADPYRIARAYDLDPVIAQAVKKLLRCGRKHKSRATDVREAITTLERWEAMEAEDSQQNTQPMETMTDTPETDGEWNRLACQDHPEFERNLADFARKLERERDEARATCSELVTDSDAITLARTVVRITQERDEARQWESQALVARIQRDENRKLYETERKDLATLLKSLHRVIAERDALLCRCQTKHTTLWGGKNMDVPRCPECGKMRAEYPENETSPSVGATEMKS